ncbi:MAG: ribbon-helix-helix protein, CopG family [Candidatus Syntrophoarchaeum sp. WYZ-LMO15]|nr:MAG: ribbon-helix-helix protein, CopG family [Candidatus Syntrophoarchaeum sp. WYZ-LMO15]
MTEVITVSMTPEVLDLIEKIAENLRKPRSKVIRDAIIRYGEALEI